MQACKLTRGSRTPEGFINVRMPVMRQFVSFSNLSPEETPENALFSIPRLRPSLHCTMPSAMSFIDDYKAAHAGERVTILKRASLYISNIYSHDAELRRAIGAMLLQEAVSRRMENVNVEPVLERSSALSVLRASQGYSRFLFGPEEGVRALLRACLGQWQIPAEALVQAVMEELIQALAAGVDSSCPYSAPEGLLEDMHAVCRSVAASCASHTVQLIRNILDAEARFPATASFLDLRSAFAAHPGVGAPPPPLYPHSLHRYFMGWLLKRSRRGRWQRRWFVLSPLMGLLWYMHDPRDRWARATMTLRDGLLLPPGVHPSSVVSGEGEGEAWSSSSATSTSQSVSPEASSLPVWGADVPHNIAGGMGIPLSAYAAEAIARGGQLGPPPPPPPPRPVSPASMLPRGADPRLARRTLSLLLRPHSCSSQMRPRRWLLLRAPSEASRRQWEDMLALAQRACLCSDEAEKHRVLCRGVAAVERAHGGRPGGPEHGPVQPDARALAAFERLHQGAHFEQLPHPGEAHFARSHPQNAPHQGSAFDRLHPDPRAGEPATQVPAWAASGELGPLTPDPSSSRPGSPSGARPPHRRRPPSLSESSADRDLEARWTAAAALVEGRSHGARFDARRLEKQGRPSHARRASLADLGGSGDLLPRPDTPSRSERRRGAGRRAREASESAESAEEAALAAEEALMAELAALQHAKPRPETRDEAAVLDLVVPVVREYVRLGCRKLTEQLPKVIAGGMLSTPAHVEEALMALVPV